MPPRPRPPLVAVVFDEPALAVPACVKTSVPWPAGRWGLVFDTARRPGRPTELYALAYGHRHPEGRQLSVYQIAHRRLHDG